MNTLIKTTLLIVCFALLSIGQNNPADNGSPDVDKQKIDQLFDQIMLTFPGEVRAKIDSASSHQADPVQSKAGEGKSAGSAASLRRDALINELPDEVRMQVEKTISDIEKRRNERALQFKEYKGK